MQYYGGYRYLVFSHIAQQYPGQNRNISNKITPVTAQKNNNNFPESEIRPKVISKTKPKINIPTILEDVKPN